MFYWTKEQFKKTLDEAIRTTKKDTILKAIGVIHMVSSELYDGENAMAKKIMVCIANELREELTVDPELERMADHYIATVKNAPSKDYLMDCWEKKQ
jgi:hypothetical protein